MTREQMLHKAYKLAEEFEGIKELLEMRADEPDLHERLMIEQELQYLINEIEG